MNCFNYFEKMVRWYLKSYCMAFAIKCVRLRYHSRQREQCGSSNSDYVFQPRLQSYRLFVGVGTTDTKLPSSGCQEYNTGVAADVVFPSNLGHHSLGFGCQWRQMFGFNSNVPLSIRQQAGHSIKSFIKVS